MDTHTLQLIRKITPLNSSLHSALDSLTEALNDNPDLPEGVELCAPEASALAWLLNRVLTTDERPKAPTVEDKVVTFPHPNQRPGITVVGSN